MNRISMARYDFEMRLLDYAGAFLLLNSCAFAQTGNAGNLPRFRPQSLSISA